MNFRVDIFTISIILTHEIMYLHLFSLSLTFFMNILLLPAYVSCPSFHFLIVFEAIIIGTEFITLDSVHLIYKI